MADHGLCCNPADKQVLEAQNTASIADYAAEFYQRFEGRSPYQTSVLRELHSLAVARIYRCAGHFRDYRFDESINILGASFQPCPAYLVPSRVRDLLTEAEGWPTRPGLGDQDPDSFRLRVEFAGECFHRLNEIHPFAGGNGRVSRAFLHLMLFDMRILTPSNPMMFEYFSYRRSAYLQALREADNGNLHELTMFIGRGVTDSHNQQLVNFINESSLRDYLREIVENSDIYDSERRAGLTDAAYLQASKAFTESIDHALARFAE